MSRDPDVPHDPTLAMLVDKLTPNGSGTLARLLELDATRRRQRARKLSAANDTAGADRLTHDAAFLERQAARFRSPREAVGGALMTGNGGEVVEAKPGPDPWQQQVQQPPDMLAAEATQHRFKLAANVSYLTLTLALELCESLGARDAWERNLLHEVAALHVLSMTVTAKAHAFVTLAASWVPEGRQQMQSIEAARLAAVIPRLTEAAQRGMTALERYRNGNRQTVTVQYVTVEAGGQAVVAGAVKPRRRKP